MTVERAADASALSTQAPVLEAGLSCMGLDVSAADRDKLLDYLSLLRRWNRAYNLTAIDQPDEMVARHLLDSLALVPFLVGRRLLDAGTGPGLPGVPLAIACPDRDFVLIDSNGKKIRFLRQVRRELGLGNIEPVQGRLESYRAEPGPDAIIARALAPLERLVGWATYWLDRGVPLLAMKGDLSESERLVVPPPYNVTLDELKVADLPERRCLATVRRQ